MLARALFVASCLFLAPLAQAQFVFGRLQPPAPAMETEGASLEPTVSADGKVFVFESTATNWVGAASPAARSSR